jgi:NADPH:quinone reductase-like Zn-dependent oxidoreductase
MFAAIATHKGGIDDAALSEIPIPEPGPHQVLIKVKAMGVNPVDWKAIGRGMFNFPYVIGTDVSGIIEKVGSETEKYKAGDEVIGSLEWTTQGAFAEYVLTEEKYITYKPLNKPHVDAAAIPLAALTAWQALFDKMNLLPGQKVLIHAASGGVGLFALQLAKWKGAYVTATASQRNLSFLKRVGADQVIDYTRNSIENECSAFDGVLDAISDEKTQEQSFRVLRKGGTYVSILAAPPQKKLDQYQINGTRFLFQSNPEQLKQIVELVEKGIINVYVEMVYPLVDFKDALRHVQTGRTRGKVVLATE